MDIWSIIFTVILLLEIFVLMKNSVAKGEMKRFAKEEGVLIVHYDTRKWVKVMRIICGVAAAVTAGFLIYMLIVWNVLFLADNIFNMIALCAAFLYFAVAPYNTGNWVLSDKGIFIYNTGSVVPWSQVITTGIISNKNHHIVNIQIKKQQGEMFKSQFQMIRVDSAEQAKEVSELIRQFVHALDRKKMFKRVQEEKRTDLKKRQWF